ncbi:hypothetical protein RND81_04G114400 [Saponaria officinalis]|uniref:B3 domain-containing protein n=1 Tax=Saponaria officinalis TaxID=3572 RepID=A0AAW1LDX7_SAPOF
MCQGGNACGTCYRNCCLIHKKKHDNPSKVSEFFKIMFGKKFDQSLAVPPAFSKKLKSLVGRKITLEDCNRRKWDVLLGNALVFQKGWHTFYLLVFYYFSDSHFLVEIFGRSACQKCFTSDTTKAARSSIPLKRPSDSSCEQPPRKRHFSSNVFSEPNADVTPRPKDIHPRFMASRDMNRPKVVRETAEEPRFTASQDQSRPKVVPLTAEKPCFVASQDQSRPKVVPVAETLIEPCFIPSREKNAGLEYDSDRLFDLSAFEMPGKKSTVDGEEETDGPLDRPVYDLRENETDVDRAEELHVKGNKSSQVSDTFQNASTGIAENKTTIDRDDVVDDLFDLSVFEMPENEYANVNDKGHLKENLHGPESDNFQNTAIKDASVDLLNRKISEIIIEEVMPESREAELRKHDGAPLTSSSPTVDLPINSTTPIKVIDKPETSKVSALSGEKMRRTNQESIKVKQDTRDDALANCSFGGLFSTNAQTKISCRKFAGSITPKVKIEADVSTIVKLEPVDCDAPSETDLKVICSVPPGIENFLLLPEPLQVALRVDRRRIKPKQQLIFLRDPAGRVWPVVYHNKSGFKANNIQPGDKCIFSVENSEEDSITVQVWPPIGKRPRRLESRRESEKAP